MDISPIQTVKYPDVIDQQSKSTVSKENQSNPFYELEKSIAQGSNSTIQIAQNGEQINKEYTPDKTDQ